VLVAAVEDDVVRREVRHEAFEHLVADATVREGEDEQTRGRERFAEGVVVCHSMSTLSLGVRIVRLCV
jgi:hypothetical protein